MKISTFFLIFIVLSCSVHAESLNVYGVPLTVRSIESLDNVSVKVTVFDESRIVLRSKLEEHVLEQYLNVPSHLQALSAENISSLVRALYDQADFRNAGRILGNATKFKKDSLKELKVFLETIRPTTQNRDLFLYSLHSNNDLPGDIAALLLIGIGSVDAGWTKTEGVKYAYKYSRDLKNVLLSRGMESVVRGDKEGAERLSRVFEEFYSNTDNEYQRFFRGANLIRSVQDAFKRENYIEVAGLLEMVDKSSDLEFMFKPHLLNLMNSEFEKLLIKSKYDEVLITLGRTDLGRRTPRTHDFIRRALEGVDPVTSNALANDGVNAALAIVSEKDESIRKNYIKALEKRIQNLLSSHAINESRHYLKFLLKVRPDVDSANDEIRLRQAKAFYDLKNYEDGAQILSEIKTGIPIGSRIDFFISKLSKLAILFDLILFLVVVVAFLYYVVPIAKHTIKRVKSVLYQEKNNQTSRIFKQTPSEEEIPMFVSINPRSAIDSLLEEYLKCLSVFGLKIGASEKEMKSAFRKLIKNVHPDINSDSSDYTSFLELKKTYERLLEINRSPEIKAQIALRSGSWSTD